MNLKISSCIDYFKFRVIDFIDLPHSEDEYLNSAHGGKEPGSADFSFIGELCSILLLKPYEYYEQLGFQGYSLWAVFDEDTFLFGGRASEVTKDGIPTFFFEMKGHALRMFELRCEEKGIDVFQQYRKLFEFCNKYSLPSNGRYLELKRIDVTIDDFSNFITAEELQHKLRSGFYTTRSTKIEQTLDYSKDLKEEVDKINEIISNGWTAYVGARGCSRQLCIYDKKAERETAGAVVTVNNWMRYEGRFFSNNAQAAFNILYTNVFLFNHPERFTSIIGSLITKIIIFREDNNYSMLDQSKVKIWDKWEKLLNPVDCEFKIQASTEKDISYMTKKNWLIKSPYMNITLEFLVDAEFEYRDDVGIKLLTKSPIEFYESDGVLFNDTFLKFIFALLKRASKKLDERKLAVVNNMRKTKNLDYIRSISDAVRLINQYIGDAADYGFTISHYYQKETNTTDDDFIEGIQNKRSL